LKSCNFRIAIEHTGGKTMEKSDLPGNLSVIPYVPSLAEYAARVRKEILNRKETNFIIAVDLPAGLEKSVMQAAKLLPEVSLVVDPIKRAIPIIPTSAPVEAVRSYLEYGLDIRFIDASLPVIGNMDEYHYFVNLCRQYGTKKVLDDPESLGISKKDIEKSWKDMMSYGRGIQAFSHLPDACTIEKSTDQKTSTYRHTRRQHMAARLQELLKEGTEVLLVITLSEWNDVKELLCTPQPSIDSSIVLPAKIAMIRERDVPTITNEIPYVMYLYEIYRDTEVGREEWLHTILEGTDFKKLSVDAVKSTADYSCRVALANHEIYPDLYNLVSAAGYIAGDEYAKSVFELAISYPPAKDTLSDYGLQPVWDYNFDLLENEDFLALLKSIIGGGWGIGPGRNGGIIPIKTNFYNRWTRTDESYQAEREFMRYMTSRFTTSTSSSDTYEPHEYVCGFGDGIDIRETIRNRHVGKLFIREATQQNIPTYVFDYRNKNQESPDSAEKNAMYFDHIFLDMYHPWIGVTSNQGKHYISGVMVVFSHLDFSPTRIFTDIRSSDPLASAVDIALKYSRSVFVFTDKPGDINMAKLDHSRVKLIPCNAIPRQVREKMSSFDISHYRHDDRPGD